MILHPAYLTEVGSEVVKALVPLFVQDEGNKSGIEGKAHVPDEYEDMNPRGLELGGPVPVRSCLSLTMEIIGLLTCLDFQLQFPVLGNSEETLLLYP